MSYIFTLVTKMTLFSAHIYTMAKHSANKKIDYTVINVLNGGEN